MQEAELRNILDNIKNVSVAVVGDFCLDAYWFVNPALSEKSVETGVDTLPVERQRYALGGAGNVVMNLLALVARSVNVFGVTGSDLFGREMRRIMDGAGNIGGSGLLIQEQNWQTHVYAKPYIGGDELQRLDFGCYNQLDEYTADKLLACLADSLPDNDVIVINEQVSSGIHNCGYFRRGLAKLILDNPHKVFLLDSRKYCDVYDGAVRKINEYEAAQLCGMNIGRQNRIARAAAMNCLEMLWQRWRKPLFLTRGAQGCLLRSEEGVAEVAALRIDGEIDPVGAGDSTLAGIAAALAAGADFAKAAEIGNMAAGVTVRKLFQTGTATPEEVIIANSLPRNRSGD